MKQHRSLAWLGSAIVVTGLTLASACSSPGSTASGAGPGTTQTSRPRAVKPTKVTKPTVTGPITGGQYGKPFNPLPRALADQYGYDEREYFIEGTATSYQPAGPWGEDGVWNAATDSSAPFKTRVVVRLPKDPGRFNGTVIVEWNNVTAGMDTEPDFGFLHHEVLRQGYGYIAVSAQKVGVDGGGGVLPIPGLEVKALKDWDATRYGTLRHPGDDFSFDIFTQAAAITLDPDGVKPFAGYETRHLLATGESQSAFRMTTYVNAVHPLTRLFDGFIVHSRGPGGAPVNSSTTASTKSGRLRTDLDEPVLQLVTETDLFGLGFHPARQPDTPKLRTWEIAGTSHADQYTLDYGVQSGREWNPGASVDFGSLCGPLNNGPQTYVARAGLASLRTWIVDGRAPATAAPIDVVDGRIARDPDGNARGGIRTAAVDAPIAELSGEQAESSSVICSLFGFTKPFTPERLSARYPTHSTYVDQVRAATQRAVDAGFVLPADQAEIVGAAEQAAVPA